MNIRDMMYRVLEKVSEEEKSMMEAWANGQFTGHSHYETIQSNSKALGIMDGLDICKHIIAEILEEIEQDD